MADSSPSTATERKAGKRYRLPGITREGIAQLSILETALWPLQGGIKTDATYDAAYSFMVGKEKRQAQVSVYAPKGLQSIDEFLLWGLLGLTLSRKNSDSTLFATPYWLLKQLGLNTSGFRYDQLRESLERLAMIAYRNTGFYNPVTQRHERATFHFFSSYLPTRGRGGPVDGERAWRIEWSPMFFQMCQATGGTLLFDLDLYRKLTPSARRLFLKLQDRFWRAKRVFYNVDDLTIQGLGFSAKRPLKKRKYDLTACIRELLAQGVIELGRGQREAKDLFLKRGRGAYVVQFLEGPYFRRPSSSRSALQNRAIAEDPLYEPLKTIGVDEAAIRRIFAEKSRGLIQQWIRITDTAMHEKPSGFPGFRTSPAAFLIDGIQNQRMPPDWIHAFEKDKERREWVNQRQAMAQEEHDHRARYEEERAAMLSEYLNSPEGRSLFDRYYAAFMELYQATEPHRVKEAAREAAIGKIKSEHLKFPEFGVWFLEQRTV